MPRRPIATAFHRLARPASLPSGEVATLLPCRGAREVVGRGVRPRGRPHIGGVSPPLRAALSLRLSRALGGWRGALQRPAVQRAALSFVRALFPRQRRLRRHPSRSGARAPRPPPPWALASCGRHCRFGGAAARGGAGGSAGLASHRLPAFPRGECALAARLAGGTDSLRGREPGVLLSGAGRGGREIRKGRLLAPTPGAYFCLITTAGTSCSRTVLLNAATSVASASLSLASCASILAVRSR